MIPAGKAGIGPMLRIVAKAVAGVCTATARLDGSTEATRVVCAGAAAKASPPTV